MNLLSTGSYFTRLVTAPRRYLWRTAPYQSAARFSQGSTIPDEFGGRLELVDFLRPGVLFLILASRVGIGAARERDVIRQQLQGH